MNAKQMQSFEQFMNILYDMFYVDEKICFKTMEKYFYKTMLENTDVKSLCSLTGYSQGEIGLKLKEIGVSYLKLT